MVANPQNLKVPTSEEARRYGSKGGKASARAKAQRKTMAENLDILLRMPLQDGPSKTLSRVKSLSKSHIKEANAPSGELLALSLLQQALKGDMKAMRLIMEVTGEAQQAQAVSPLDSLAKELERYKEEDGDE